MTVFPVISDWVTVFVFPSSSIIVIANVGLVFDVVLSISTDALKPTLVSSDIS